MQPLLISGYDQGGLNTSLKPWKLPNEAFSELQNAYVYHEQVLKRGTRGEIGRLRRALTGESLGTSPASGLTYSDNIKTDLSLETDAQLEPGSITITVGTLLTVTDDGDGTFTQTGGSGTLDAASSSINYNTMAFTLELSAGAYNTDAVTVDLGYYPMLPVMGITTQELSGLNAERTIFYDTKYPYIFSGGEFTEFIGGSTWNLDNAQFMWATNYRGANPYDRLYFVTPFVSPGGTTTAANPMRYTDGTTWTTFNPALDGGGTPERLYSCRILVPYYGRLVALNTYEGTAVGSTQNYWNRCRFSQIGDPVEAAGAGPPETGAWRTDIFGKGGFIDAPTNEAIVSAGFIKNALIVQFERSTWQLKYVGEYGLPFQWERVSSDFGAESTFSTVEFDDFVLYVGNYGIVAANANNVQRIDNNINDLVFNILNAQNGPYRVQGERDFGKQLVYWSYPDADLSGNASDSQSRIYPNRTLVYNYENKTFGIFDDRITALGIFQSDTNITWDSTTVTWDDDVPWDGDPSQQSRYPLVVCGNSQGYITEFNSNREEAPTLAITAINTGASPAQLTVPAHMLESTSTNGEAIEPTDEGMTVVITGTLWSGTDPNINGNIYGIKRIDEDTISLLTWDADSGTYTDVDIAGTYIGGGEITCFPQMYIQTKDFNPYIDQNSNLKLINADFLIDDAPDGEVSVEIFLNSSYNVKANLNTGQTKVIQALTRPYFTPGNAYAWKRVNVTAAGEFARVIVTYSDEQMNDKTIQSAGFVLNAMKLSVRPGAKVVF